MRAVVIHAAHDLRIEERSAPVPEAEMVHVRIEAGGICGSDLHYYNHGGFGSVRLREPMILGHEVAGTVISAPEVSGLAKGDRVAVSPSRPCEACRFCEAGLQNHCENMRFYGSAMPMPHIQGAFRDEILATPDQCVKVSRDTPSEIAAFAEPLAVVIHGLSRAGGVGGKRVLVTGCGPIGALAVLAARAEGASEVVVTDLLDHVLSLAETLGADRAINVGENDGWAEEFSAGKGHFDAMIEASGSPHALPSAIAALAPRAVVAQLGLGAEVSVPMTPLAAKEIELRGAFRFHKEFSTAVQWLDTGRVDVAPLLSARFPLAEAQEAFQTAADRSRAMKVQLDFTT